MDSLSMAAAASPMGAMAKGLAAVAVAAVAATAAVGGLVAKFTSAAVEMADFLAGSERAIDVLTKKAGEGDRAVTVALEMAGRFNFDPRESVSQMHKMISKGFSTQESTVMLTALADLKVLAPDANMDALTLAIGQVKGKASLSMEELNQQIAEAGLPAAKVLEQIAKRMGKSVPEIQKAISAGKISGQQGIEGIIDAIKEMGTGKLGEMAEQAARNSFKGLANGIKTSLSLALVEVASAINKGGGMEALKNAMRNLLDGLDPSKTPGAKRLTTAASGFVNTLLTSIFGPLSEQDAGQMVGKVFDRMGVALEKATDIMREIGPLAVELALGFGEGLMEAFSSLGDAITDVTEALGLNKGNMRDFKSTARTIGKALGVATAAATVAAVAFAGVVAAIGAIVTGGTAMLANFFAPFIGIGAMVKAAFYGTEQVIRSLPDRVKAAGSDLLTAGVTMGSNLWTGFVQGIEAGITAVTDSATRLATAAKSAVAGALRIQSPSRVMMEMGGYTAQGFAQGVDGGAGQVDAAMTNMVAPPAPVLGTGATSTTNTLAAGGISIVINIQGNEGGAQPGAVAAEARKGVMDALEQLVAQMGLSPEPQGA